MPTLAEISKAVAALSAAVAALVAQGVVTGALAHILTGVLGAVVVFLATYKAPANKARPARGAHVEKAFGHRT